MPLSQNRAIVELLVTAFAWGFGFIASRWMLIEQDVSWGQTARYLLALAVGFPIVWVARRRGIDLKVALRDAALPGTALGVMLLLQNYGLKYTSVANSAFLTCLYVVFVPLLEPLAGHRVAGTRHWILVILALAGAGLMAGPTDAGWNMGDGLTVLAAFCGALQILAVQRVASRVQSAFVTNYFQAFFCLWPSLAAALIAGGPITVPVGWEYYAGLFSLAIGSTLIAFAIQVRAQAVLPMSLVSMLFLLEAPIAAVFAWMIFREPLRGAQQLGGGLILLAAALCIWQRERPALTASSR